MKLVIEREVSPSRFAEVGRPAGAYRREDGQFVALASTFDSLYWPARATYKGHWLRHRLSVYSGDLERHVASFDRAGFPINDVAFHPSRPLVAIATGSYDGGFFFEGELVLWNWLEGTHWTVLSDNREATRCRFSSDSELTVLFRPQHEEELELAAGDPFETFVGAILDDWRSYEELGLSHRHHWEAYVEGFVSESGETTWSHRVDALATTLVSVEDEPLVVYALTDGQIGVLNWKTGEVLFEDVLDIDGLPTVALSMAARGRRLAIGGVEGRIILARLVD